MRPRCTTRPSSITATLSPSAGHHEVLLDEQDRGLLRLQLAEGADQVLDDRRRQALARLVDEDQRPRLADGARHRQHLLLPARELARRVQPELLQRREEAEDPVQPRRSSSPSWRALRAASTMFSFTVRSVKMPMLSGT
jgi:hypothetical protein